MKLLSLFLFSLAMACSQANPDASPTADQESSGYATPEAAREEVAAPTQSTATPATIEQKIIKTARLVFQTETMEETHQNILQLVKKNNGSVQNNSSGKDYNRHFRNLVVRIPTENFQSFIANVAEGVTYFEHNEISQQDVTEEFVDLEARLKAKRELENRYIELLKKATTVKEMLEIERELSTIREEIEARQGRLQYLQSQVSMSTVYINFYKITAETGATVSYGQKIKNAILGGWNGISVFFIGILYLWPLLILFLLIFIFLRSYKRRNKKLKSNL